MKKYKVGGVAICVNYRVQFQQLQVKFKCKLDFEVEGIKITSKHSGKIIIIGPYGSPNRYADKFFLNLCFFNNLFFLDNDNHPLNKRIGF